MRRLIIWFQIFYTWLFFPIMFPLWRMGNKEDVTDDYLFWHLSNYTDMSKQKIIDVCNSTYNQLNKKIHSSYSDGGNK